jgi:preprotein translocase subunit YajC
MNSEMLGKLYDVLNTFLPIACLMGIFYVMVVLPQRKKAAEQKTMWDHLKKGQTVVMNSGIFGVIEAITEEKIHLRIAKDVVIEVEKTSISRLDEAQKSPKA